MWPGWKDLRLARNLIPNNYMGNRLAEKLKGFSSSGQMPISDLGLDLLSKMLIYDPTKRIKASEALKHAWFSESPPAQEPDLMPTFPAMNEAPRDAKKKKHPLEANGH